MRRGIRFTPWMAALAGIALAGGAALAAGPTEASGKKPGASSPAWESLKTLQGEWDGLYDGKVAGKASYRLVSGGTVLMETLVSPDHTDMITMYHPDGAGLVMTHYCSENNQPRMRASSTDPKRVAFRYLDATNLSSPDAPRMSGLVVTLKDADHFTQDWTYTAGGKDMASTFAYTRKK
ncbi:MAG: hypothetical protein M3S32_09875 [Acidobacteriota bacterium]|nr:hypothetical protein [Acidobacteriota bacterium]